VFTLLETIYCSFDRIAQRHGVYKVETIGDCYVAVVGLPERRRDHALVMARFARDTLAQMKSLIESLTAHLGPETANLKMRYGLHSGSVTAGVLRGQSARYQLFGDSVSTAARIESAGFRGKIHLSESTADLLVSSGKGRWVVAREDRIDLNKLRGIQTYWLKSREESESVSMIGSSRHG
jgi:class 3 adenylate cyclase